MKSIGEKILDFFHMLSKFLIFGGILAFVSLFFTPNSIPLWRILLGIIPLIAGSILGTIVKVVSMTVYTTQAVVDKLQELKENKQNRDKD